MAVSPWAAALASRPGYVARPASQPVVSGAFPALPSVPQLPALDARAPNTATRDWLLQQLGPLAQQNQAALTNIQAGAKLQLAGYGGWKFGTDNPNTPEREDLQLAFDPKGGPGEREKQAIRAEDNAANARGLLHSSFRNQNVGSALQRLSLEGQQIANQYASALTQQHSAYAGQVSSIARDWTQLYGADSSWLIENPPPTPDPVPAPVAQNAIGSGGGVPQGYSVIWKGKAQPSRAGVTKWNQQYGNNWFIVPSHGGYVVVARTA